MTSNNFGFPDYNLYRDSLSKIIARSELVFSNLGQEDIADSIAETKHRLDSGVFRILIVGEFNRGKSTLINTLLGEDILPVKRKPTTSIVNAIKYGEEKRAVLHFKHPLPDNRGKVADDAERHIVNYVPNPIPPLDVPYQQLEKYVTIQGRRRQKAEILTSPYKLLELYYPSDLLVDGIEFLDSPGLNEAAQRTSETLNSLGKADAVVYLFNAKAFGSETEMDSVQQEILEAGFRKIFYVINHWDDLVEEDKEEAKGDAYDLLEAHTDYGKNGIFFLAALEALKFRTGKAGHNPYVNDFHAFEKKLYSTLIKDAGKTKIDKAVEYMRRKLTLVEPLVKDLLISYDQSLEETTRSYKKTLPLLEAAKKTKELTISKILHIRRNIKELIASRLEVKLYEISEMIPEWVEELELDNKLKALSLDNKNISERIEEEIQEAIDDRISSEMEVWQEEELQPDLIALAKEMQEGIMDGRDELATNISHIAETFSGLHMTEEERKDSEASIGSRIITGGLALLIGDIPLAIYGAQHGSKGIGKALLTQVGIGIGLAIIGITNPLVWIAAAFGGSIFSSITYNEKKNREYKAAIAYQLQENFNKSITKQAENAAQIVFEKTERISIEVEQDFNAEIQAQEDKVNHAFKLKQKGDAVVAKQRALAEEQIRDKELILRELQNLEKTGI